MKVLEFVPYFLPYSGGQERYVYGLGKYLAGKGHEVHVVTSDYPPCSMEIADGINIKRHPLALRILRNPIAPGFIGVPKTFDDYDIIHTHNEHSSPALIAAFFHRCHKPPLVLTNHGRLIFGRPWSDAIETVYMKSIGRYVLRTCDRIVVNSFSDKKYLCNLDGSLEVKTSVLHNALDLETFQKAPVPPAFADSVLKSEVRVLFVGRLMRRKGIGWLIEAIGIARRSVKGIYCILVGEGEDSEYFHGFVRKLGLESNILFAGRIRDEELIWLYENCDMFVLPSLSEVCSTSILEAMHFGMPVVATDIPGNSDHFRDHAILVPAKNAGSMAEAIVGLSRDEVLARSLSKKGKMLIDEKYSWETVGKEYESIFSRL
jgi:glycosyltransferase involved in cell wall biosynthesis